MSGGGSTFQVRLISRTEDIQPDSLGRRRPPVFATQARGDEAGKVDHCMMLTLLWLEVALVKAMKDCVRHEEHQPEDKDRVRVMVKVVIGVPIPSQLVEPFVLDFPSVVSEGRYGFWRR